jgi:uncharacterized membrane protein YqjE
LTEQETSELAKAIQDVSERASLLVREEIALAKAELSEKVGRLAKGVAVGAAAGVFLVAALVYFLHFLALLIWKLVDGDGNNVWIGYAIVTLGLVVLAVIAGFLAARWIRKGSPPTPQMAIEEAQLIKATLTAPHPGSPSGAVQPATPQKVETR